ncbi:WD repeat protein [Wolffia australiana]
MEIEDPREPLIERTAEAISDVPSGNGAEPITESAKKSKSPEVEVHLFRKGRGPEAVFKSKLGGWGQDQLEVQDILDNYGFKTLYAFNPASGRGVSIRFNPKNGRSLLPYNDGAVIFVDGEPKDSLVKPITKILFGVAVTTLLVAFLVKENPSWLRSSKNGGWSFPPWILACVVVVFTRVRKRTKDFLGRRGWLI